MEGNRDALYVLCTLHALHSKKWMQIMPIKTTNTGKILFLGPQVIALNISLRGH